MIKINRKTKTITATGPQVKLMNLQDLRRLENAGWTINIIIGG